MMKLVRTGLLLAALSAPLSGAGALTSYSFANKCGGNTFTTCASGTITASTSAGVTTITFSITNVSAANGAYPGTIFTAMGLWGLPSYTYVPNSFSASGSGSWVFGTPGLSGAGISAQTAGGSPNGQVSNGLANGQSVTFTFQLTGVSEGAMDLRDWAVHGQDGPNGCSTKLVSTDGVTTSTLDPACDSGGGTTAVAPEPASIVMLGTGLFGLAGMVSRRRRLR